LADAKAILARCAYRGTAEVSVYVDEKFRRRGVGRTLLGEAIARAASLKIDAMVGLIFATTNQACGCSNNLASSAGDCFRASRNLMLWNAT